MKTVAIILAGGVGSRMGLDYPKQFLMIQGKPLIVHTTFCFQKNSNITSILIVCEKNWIGYVKQLIDEYKLTKVSWIIPGGKTSHDSTRNGIFYLSNILNSEDYVIIHDAARPILPQKAIDNMIDLAKHMGNAALAIPCYETVLLTDDKKSGKQPVDRNKLMRIQTPQMYLYKDIKEAYDKAENDDIHDFVYANMVAVYYGMSIYFSKGFTNNIKVTCPEDVPLVESLMNFSEEQLYNFK